MRKVIPLAALTLIGCATDAGINQGMQRFTGQPIQQVFDRIGYPEKQETFAGDHVYYFGTDRDTGPSCTLKVVAGPDNRVKTWSGEGNIVGCDHYGRALNR